MITIFETDKGSYEIKEHLKYWTIKLLGTPDKLQTKINLSKKDYITLDDVKSFILATF